MNVLVLNSGSSTLKFQIIKTDLELIGKDADHRLARGNLERIGSQSLITLQAEGQQKIKQTAPLRDHRAAIDTALRWIISPESKIENINSFSDIHAVGHRVVHGGEKFIRSVLINDEVLKGLEECIELAPIHNPSNIKGIRESIKLLGTDVPQVAVFDTAFHSTMPETSFLYGLPYQLYRRYKIRRYGFHGTSHRYIAYSYRKQNHIEKEKVNIISLHLGNGCSACAIKGGASIDTSMGFTPLEGLLMGTRSGDLDPSILEYLHHKEGMNLTEIDTLLNKQSGLLGLSGLTSDMQELIEEDAENQDRRARLAIDIFCFRIKKYIGAYFVIIGETDALIFTGGIGENSPIIREKICDGLDCIGIKIDKIKNKKLFDGRNGVISQNKAKLKIFVIPTNEELLIARDTVRVLEDAPRRW